jgi:DNA-binding Lrp family transcriptional regulator
VKEAKRKGKPAAPAIGPANPGNEGSVREVDLREVTVAYLLIKAQLGHAARVAAAASAVEGVRWASVVTGPYDVVAGVRVPDNDALEKVVTQVGLIDGVANPLTLVMTSYFQDGEKESRVWNGPP